MSLRFLFLLFVASSVIGSTLVGWLAVAKIRRSKGRLYGLRLALFAGLAFPLLALDGVIAWFLSYATGHVSNWIIAGGGPLPWIAQTYLDLRIAFLGVAIVVISLVVDGLIFWAIWKRLRQPETRPATSPSGTPKRQRKLVFIGTALLLCLPLFMAATAALTWWTSSRSPAVAAAVTLEIQPPPTYPQPLRTGFVAKELQLMRTTQILYPVIERLELTREFTRPGQPKVPNQQAYVLLNRMLEAQQIRGTELVRLRIHDDDYFRAANIANTIAVVYKEARSQDGVTVKIWEQAEPSQPAVQSRASWVVVPLILLPGGLLAVVGLVLLVIGLVKNSPPPPAAHREKFSKPKTTSATVSSEPREDRPSLRPEITLLLCLPLSFAAAFGYAVLTPEKPRAMIKLEVKSDSPEEAQGFEKRALAQFGEAVEWRIGERSFGRADDHAPLVFKAVGELSVSGNTPEEAMEKATTWARSVEQAGRVRIVQSAQPMQQQVSYPRFIRIVGSSLIGGGILATLGFVLLTRRLARVKSAAPVPASAPGQARLAIWMLILSLLGTPLLLTLAPRSEFPLFFGGLALLLALIFGALGSSLRSARTVVFTVLVLVIGGSIGMAILLLHNERTMTTMQARERTRMNGRIAEQFARAQKEDEMRRNAEALAKAPRPKDPWLTEFGELSAEEDRWRVRVSSIDLTLQVTRTGPPESEVRPLEWRAHDGWFVYIENAGGGRVWAFDGERSLLLFCYDKAMGLYSAETAPFPVPEPVLARLPEEVKQTIKPAELAARERLLELELQLATAKATLPATHPQVRELEQKLSAEQKQNPDLYDAVFWDLAQQKRKALATQRAELLRTGYGEDHPRSKMVQQRFDAVSALISRGLIPSGKAEPIPKPKAEDSKENVVLSPAEIQALQLEAVSSGKSISEIITKHLGYLPKSVQVIDPTKLPAAPSPADPTKELSADSQKRRETQERLLEVELKAIELRRTFLPGSARMNDIESHLAEMEKQQPGLHDSAFWKLVEGKRDLLVAERDRLKAIYLDSSPRVSELQAMINSLGELLAQRPVDLAALPPPNAQPFVSAPYLRAAAYLQALGQKAACEKMKQAAEANREGRQVIVLCRMLFTKKDDEKFRRPELGSPGFLGGTRPADWPLEPIAEVKGVPFLIVRDYSLRGKTESAAAYLKYCMEQCSWNDFRFAQVPPGQMRESLDELIKSTAWKQPLDEEERLFLARQIEE